MFDSPKFIPGRTKTMPEELNVIFFDKADVGKENFDKIWDFAEKLKATPNVYDSVIDKAWYENLNFCGCGVPDVVQDWIKRVLEAIKERSDGDDWRAASEKIRTVIGCDKKPAYWFTLYVLDAMGLLEHGSSIGGSWLTDKGKDFLKLLQTKPTEQ